MQSFRFCCVGMKLTYPALALAVVGNLLALVYPGLTQKWIQTSASAVEFHAPASTVPINPPTVPSQAHNFRPRLEKPPWWTIGLGKEFWRGQKTGATTQRVQKETAVVLPTSI